MEVCETKSVHKDADTGIDAKANVQMLLRAQVCH